MQQTAQPVTKEPVIQVDGVKKQYTLGQIGGGTLTADLQSWWARLRGKEDPNLPLGTDTRLFGRTFMALNGIDLTVYKGEALGIIGRNGAGKSTLLKLLSRITAPSEGEIRIKGRIASMLEVGTGFNQEMTGRENIYMNGAILGMSKAEVDSKLEQIIAFSECADFIDTPVKRYSSGMFVKLAFAVAAHLDSEIMIMDEVLAVGDMKFQEKCLNKMGDVAGQEGRTVLYVSHNMSTIRQLCTRCIVLDKGRVLYDGDVETAIAIYMDTTDVNVVDYDLTDTSRLVPSAGFRLFVERLRFLDKQSSVFAAGEPVRVEIRWRVSHYLDAVNLKLFIHFRDSSPVGITHPITLGSAEPGRVYTTVFTLDTSVLGPGQYFFRLDVFEREISNAICLDMPGQDFAFEITSADRTLPIWLPYWGHIHFPPLVVEDNQHEPLEG
ncbi:MAG: ATP-binding cassette domain-containing protein [Candidatus Fournierella pullistercoris]|uniref:ATP-binding cassette domain-containing protein n=1 Tax=Candidatus Allofournierella pullistercoris TaxID=2838597 RepID=A0A948T2A1_9FIRM|nr:ATP-binding cassette domain-containing protein [Candidatus Fournierella pullistercoris]